MTKIDDEVRHVASVTAHRILNHQHPHLVDDVISRVMIQWEDWKRRGVEHPKAWAGQVARNVALEIIAEEKKQAIIVERITPRNEPTSINDGLLNLMTTECQDTLISLISVTEQAREASLDETDQAIYERVYQKDLNYTETAAELGMAEAAVRQRVHRLVLKVRDEVHARIRGDQNLRQMLQHFLDDPKWLGKVLSLIMEQVARKGKNVMEKAIRGTTLITLLCRLSWKWKERSAVKITERTREETKKALHRRREGRDFEAAFAGTGAGLQAL